MVDLLGLVVLLGGFWYMIRRYLDERIGQRLDRIEGELKANGGRSLKDVALQTRDGMNELKGRMDAHIDLHLQKDRD